MNKSSIMEFYKKYLDGIPWLSTELKKLLLAWVDRNFTYEKTTKLHPPGKNIWTGEVWLYKD